MRAIGLMKHGGPEVLELFEVPEVKAEADEILVQVFCAAINPTDILARNGGIAERQKPYDPPYVPGMDISGKVVEIGENVKTHLKKGDAVMAMVIPNGQHGAYREQIALKSAAVVPIPEGVSFEEACTLPMNGLTAKLSLELLNLNSGDKLAVTGSAGAYGGYMIQIAKTLGLDVIADTSEKDQNLIKSLGADLLLPRGEEFIKHILERFPEGVDGLADGALLNEKAVAAVKNGGSFTAVRGYQGTGERDINFTQTWVRTQDCMYEKLDDLRKLVNANKVSLRLADTFSPSQVSEAHKRFEGGGVRGRLVIKFC